MKTKKLLIISIVVLGMVGTAPAGIEWVQKAKLTTTDGANSDTLGWSVCIDPYGSWAVMSAPHDDRGGPGKDYGSVYIFQLSQSVWLPYDKLYDSISPDEDDRFGYSVGCSYNADYIIVGAPWDGQRGINAGVAYIFKKNPWGGYTQKYTLTHVHVSPGDLFGYSVVIDRLGQYAVVGAPHDDWDGTNAGAAYAFYSSDGWNNASVWKLQAPTSEVNSYDFFGGSVSTSSTAYAIVGAPDDDETSPATTDSGAAYVFKKVGNNWVKDARLTASIPADNEHFGRAVDIAMGGNFSYAIVGAPGNNKGAGAAYVFERLGTGWVQRKRLIASDASSWALFGNGVSMNSNFALVGAPWDDRPYNSGAVYAFRRDVNDWIQEDKLKASDAANGDSFGAVSVMKTGAIGSGYGLVGSRFDDHPQYGTDSGSGYVFRREMVNNNLRVVIPNAAETFLAGTSYPIMWETVEDIANVNLTYSTDGGDTWIEISEYEENDGEYEWAVPAVDSSQCLIKLSDPCSPYPPDDPNSYDVSNNVFTIATTPIPPDADLNRDWLVNFIDLAIMADQWLESHRPDPTADVVFAEDFESGNLDNWEFTYSTNGQQSGTLNPPGTWSSEIDANALEGLFSARIFADSDTSGAPWMVDAAISRQVGAVQELIAKLKFDAIEGSAGVGHSFFQIALFSAADPAKSISYGFSTTGDIGGNINIAVNPGDELDFASDVAQDYFDKYGTQIPDDLILRFRSSADYDEGYSDRRTTNVLLDWIVVK